MFPVMTARGRCGSSFIKLMVFGGVAAACAENSLVTFLSIAVFAIIWKGALATPYRTLMASFLSMQWLQVTMAVWLAELHRLDLSVPQVFDICAGCNVLQWMDVTSTTVQAIVMALSGLVALAFGTRVLEPKIPAWRLPLVDHFDALRLFLGYVGLLVPTRRSPAAAPSYSQTRSARRRISQAINP